MTFEASVNTSYLYLGVAWPVALAVTVILAAIAWKAMTRARS